MLDKLPNTEKALSRLEPLGLSLAIDDLGKGYSSPPKASTPARADA